MKVVISMIFITFPQCNCSGRIFYGKYGKEPKEYIVISLPEKLCQLGLPIIGKEVLPIVFPYAAALEKN
jgi:hypothetical protein